MEQTLIFSNTNVAEVQRDVNHYLANEGEQTADVLAIRYAICVNNNNVITYSVLIHVKAK